MATGVQRKETATITITSEQGLHQVKRQANNVSHRVTRSRAAHWGWSRVQGWNREGGSRSTKGCDGQAHKQIKQAQLHTPSLNSPGFQASTPYFSDNSGTAQLFPKSVLYLLANATSIQERYSISKSRWPFSPPQQTLQGPYIWTLML